MSQDFLPQNMPQFVDRLFSLFPGLENSNSPIMRTNMSNSILVDIINEEKKITIYAELPGIRKEDIKIDLFNNKLTISAERKALDESVPTVTIQTVETRYGKFERVITLPICVTRKETVSVSLQDGILKIEINKLIEEENRFSVRV